MRRARVIVIAAALALGGSAPALAQTSSSPAGWGPPAGEGAGGGWYWPYDCRGNPMGPAVYLPPGAAPAGGGGAGGAAPTPINPAQLAQQALGEMIFPDPTIHMNPDPAKGDQIVG